MRTCPRCGRGSNEGSAVWVGIADKWYHEACYLENCISSLADRITELERTVAALSVAVARLTGMDQ